MAQSKVMFIAAIEGAGMTMMLTGSGQWSADIRKAKRFHTESYAERCAHESLGEIGMPKVTFLKVARQWALVV